MTGPRCPTTVQETGIFWRKHNVPILHCKSRHEFPCPCLIPHVSSHDYQRICSFLLCGSSGLMGLRIFESSHTVTSPFTVVMLKTTCYCAKTYQQRYRRTGPFRTLLYRPCRFDCLPRTTEICKNLSMVIWECWVLVP